MVQEILGHVGLESSSVAGRPLMHILDDLFALMSEHYRCEYIFKNAIVNKLFLELHDPSEATVVSEFRSGTCRADVVILNGTSSAYEIKTDLDSLSKLPAQAGEYAKIFDRVNVVTTPSLGERVVRDTDDGIGVIVLSADSRLRTLRKARSNKRNVSPAMIFDCMRREEYVEAVRRETGRAPDVPNTRIYSECKRVFCGLRPQVAHSYLVQALKRRTLPAHILRLTSLVPESLKHACLSMSCSAAVAERVRSGLMAPCV
ncbi:sce7726 family protein [Sorangium sp. So ce1099]|uniref:sce7726 family protein n=1 Tax=Sorangium sp. So ce1099 TaxID=3133331 RepID=UPI003F5DDD51